MPVPNEGARSSERLLLYRYHPWIVLLARLYQEAPSLFAVVLGIEIALSAPVPEPRTKDPTIAPRCGEGNRTHMGSPIYRPVFSTGPCFYSTLWISCGWLFQARPHQLWSA